MSNVVFIGPRVVLFALAGGIALAGLALAPRTVSAQDEEVTYANIKGEVKSVVPGGIFVEDPAGNAWQIKQPTDLTELSITGTADDSFLRPGLLVRFEAVVNKKLEIEAPISSLTVITERDQYDVGMIPTGGGATEGGGAFFGAPDEKKKPKKAPKPKIENEAEYKIGAYITGIKNGKITFNAGGTNLKGELAETMKVSVDAANLEFARVGDKVDADVMYYESRKMLGVPCESRKMTIKASAPFAADTGKKKGKSAAKKPAPKATFPKAKTKPAKSDDEMEEDKEESGKKEEMEEDEKKPGKKAAEKDDDGS